MKIVNLEDFRDAQDMVRIALSIKDWEWKEAYWRAAILALKAAYGVK